MRKLVSVSMFLSLIAERHRLRRTTRKLGTEPFEAQF
jgi:hypothetical protein